MNNAIDERTKLRKNYGEKLGDRFCALFHVFSSAYF